MLEVWIQQDAAGLFDIRYRVERGRGMLRFRQSGLLVSTPATSEGIRRGLDLEELSSCRFTLLRPDVPPETHTFEDLSPYELENLEENDWVLLHSEEVRGKLVFVLMDEAQTDETPAPLQMHSSIQSRQREMVLEEEVRRLSMELTVAREQLARSQQQSTQQGALIGTLREQIKLLLERKD